MKKWIFTSLLLTVTWIFVRGTTPENIPEELLTGSILSFPTVYIFRNMFPGETDTRRQFRNIVPATRYTSKFIIEMLTANIDVAKRVLLPSMPINPDIIEVPLETESSAAITVLANSITLTPGTLTLDYNENRNSLLIHTIDSSDENSVIEPIRYWEEKLMKMTGELE